MPCSFRFHSVIDTVSSRLPAGHIYYPGLWGRGGKTVLQIVEILLSGNPEDQAEDLEWISGICLRRCDAAFCTVLYCICYVP